MRKFSEYQKNDGEPYRPSDPNYGCSRLLIKNRLPLTGRGSLERAEIIKDSLAQLGKISVNPHLVVRYGSISI